MAERMTAERFEQIKNICACVPFIDGSGGGGVAETQAAIRELLAEVQAKHDKWRFARDEADHLGIFLRELVEMIESGKQPTPEHLAYLKKMTTGKADVKPMAALEAEREKVGELVKVCEHLHAIFMHPHKHVTMLDVQQLEATLARVRSNA
jgi:hypothetical protein